MVRDMNVKIDQGRERICLNCGAAVSDDFCGRCGQETHVHRTLCAFLHDFIHGVLHLEGKVFRTLPLLVLRPGELTRRYIDGERRRFVSPIALFLFSIFLMFAVFQLSGIRSPADLGVPTEEVEASASAGGTSDVFVIGSVSDGTGLSVRKTGCDWLDRGLEKWSQNPSLMLYKFQANSYKFSWLLILISIPFVSLLFLRDRRYNHYDHAVFVTYSISFITLLMVTLSMLFWMGFPTTPIAATAVLVPPVHLYLDLRGTYRLSRFGALLRLMALLLMIMVVVAVFLELLWLIGIAS